MKKFFVMAALAMAAISCTKSDVLDSPVLNQEISFNTYLGKAPVSKATIQDSESVKENFSFTVEGIKHIADESVESGYKMLDGLTAQKYLNNRTLSYVVPEGSTAGSWQYSGKTLYWPTDGSSLRFFAYGDNVKNSFVLADSGNSNTLFEYTVADNLAEQQDLIVANTAVKGMTEQNPAVELNFKHLLSRIGFSLISNSGTPVHVTSLKLVGNEGKFFKQATVDLLGELELSTNDAAAEEFAYTIISSKTTFVPQFGQNEQGEKVSINVPMIQAAAEGATADVDNRYLMIIPQGASKIEGTFTIGDDETPRPINIDLSKVAALQGDEATGAKSGFLAGKAYEFILNVKTYEISFNVTVDEWDLATGDDFMQNI